MDGLIGELTRDISKHISKEVKAVSSESHLLGEWASRLYCLPDRKDGVFCFGERLVREIEESRLHFECFYAIPVPGILMLTQEPFNKSLPWNFQPSIVTDFVFQADDGSMILSNEDTSVLRILTRLAFDELRVRKA